MKAGAFGILGCLREAESHTGRLSDANNPETAWFTRGVLDALRRTLGEPIPKDQHVTDAGGIYQKFYSAGYFPVINSATKVEVL